MNKAEGLISNQQQALGNISASQYAATRESAQSIVDGMKKLHQREFAAWSWLARAMDETPPNKDEEAALWELVCRARRERY